LKKQRQYISRLAAIGKMHFLSQCYFPVFLNNEIIYRVAITTIMPFQKKPKRKRIEVKPIFVTDFPKYKRIRKAPIARAIF
jgi:hypothetical protein